MTWYKNRSLRSKLLIAFMFVLILSIGAGTFAIKEMITINNNYTNAMNVTGQRMKYIHSSTVNLTDAQHIMSIAFNPGNTHSDLITMAASKDAHLASLTNNMENLKKIASPAILNKIDTIQPMLEKYKADTGVVIEKIINDALISPDGSASEDVITEAYAIMKTIDAQYAENMSFTVNEMPIMALAVLDELTVTNGTKAGNDVVIAIVILSFMALVTLMIAFNLPRLFCKPLGALTSFMENAGKTGDITIRDVDVEVITEFSNYTDEIGRLIKGSAAFIGHVTNTAGQLKTIAGGDLAIDIKPLSEADTMGKSMENMLYGLNKMFGDIQSSSIQVSTGSKQVADGAHSLAQGSTEQAASIQELSSSISDIAQRTMNNAEIATKTAALSETIKRNAEKGSIHMDEMIKSVNEINDSSQHISKIIHTIDDIAFQTNILALNAAVEAARAGQHGKGFAVVAEEVRSLASKSAKAAKDTGIMIQDSMEKAALGARIACDTAASLTEIVAGVKEAGQYVDEISRASMEQTTGIQQINIGIDQVAQVVQQNSATAEESAAASQEMYTQSASLRDVISKFKTKEFEPDYGDDMDDDSSYNVQTSA